MVTTDKVDITDLQTYLDLKEMGFEFEGAIISILGVYAHIDRHTEV